MEITDLVAKIHKRPTMYIGERSIHCLKAFLDGWLLDHEGASSDHDFMIGFQEWVQNRFKVTTTQSWAQIITFYSPDQVAALDHALELLMVFCAIRAESTSGATY